MTPSGSPRPPTDAHDSFDRSTASGGGQVLVGEASQQGKRALLRPPVGQGGGVFGQAGLFEVLRDLGFRGAVGGGAGGVGRGRRLVAAAAGHEGE